MFGSLKDQVTVLMVAESAGPVESFQKTKVVADHGLDDCPKLDLLLVPGGWGTLQQLENERVHPGAQIRCLSNRHPYVS